MTLTQAAAGRLPKRRRRRARTLKHYATVAMFMSPWIVGFLAFTLYPTVASLYYSFTHFDLLSDPQWVGLDNYSFMFTFDPYFWDAVKNTLWMVLVQTPLQVVFAIGVALVLVRIKRGAGVYRTIFFLPTMVPIVAAALGFVFLLNPSGPLDRLLAFLHLPQPLWFQDPRFSKPGLVMLGLWGIGNTMIIFLAALLDVPEQLYEAARLEGANSWQQFRAVTLPMISPVIFFAVVIGVIYGFQYFTEGYVASGDPSSLGSPQQSLLFYTIWLYEQGFQLFHMGYAAALAWILFVVTIVCTMTLLITSRRWVHYQGGFW